MLVECESVIWVRGSWRDKGRNERPPLAGDGEVELVGGREINEAHSGCVIMRLGTMANREEIQNISN